MPNQRLSLLFTRAIAGVFLLVPFSAYSQTDNKAKLVGTISGKVTVSDSGIGDIVVTAQLGDRPGQPALARAKTDANGRYRLPGLTAGQYQITAIAPAWAFVDQSGYSGSFYGAGKVVVLAAGEDVDDVEIKLLRGGVITGRVTDADGKPVVEERVTPEIVDQNGNPTKQPALFMWNYQMTQTDDRGVYRIYGLSAGRYRVSVGRNESGFIGSRSNTYYPLTFYGDTTDATKATVVELQEGSEAGNIDIRVGRASRTFFATGRLIDSDTGQPIPGTRLMYGPARPNQPFYGGYVGTPTGPRGDFRLEGLEPGRYGISISASYEASSHYSDPLLFEIRDADVTNLELRATRGLTLSGVVIFEGSQRKDLQQQIGTLRVGASVTSPTNSQSQSFSSSGIAADGSFQITGVRPGKVRLVVAAYSNPALRGITTLRAERGGVDVLQTLELQPGESLTDLRIVAGLGTGTIRGTVRFVGGELPPNMRLFVNVKREGATASGGGLVDARGHFVIGNLTGGTYEVTLHVSSNIPPAGRRIKPQMQTVAVSDDGEAQLDFIVDLTAKEGGP